MKRERADMKRTCRIFLILTALLISLYCMGCAKKPPEEVPTPTPELLTPAPTIAAPVMAPVTPPPQPTPVTFPTMGYVNSEGVNIRSQPSTNGGVIDIMGENVPLTIVSQQDGWYRIDLDGTTAYVSEKLVTLGDPPRKHNMHWAKVSVKEAKLFKSPEGKDPSGVKLKKGELLKVLRKMGDYLHVVHGGNLQRYIAVSDVEYITEEEFKGTAPSGGSATPSPTPSA